MIEYNHNWYELDQAAEEVQKRAEESFEDHWDKMVPGAQQTNKEDEEEGVTESDIYPVFAAPSAAISSYSDFTSRTNTANTDQEEVMSHYLPEEEYLELVRSLNKEQREFFQYVLHNLKTKDVPVHLFLTGGAGVGKTVVVNAIYQAMLRFYNKGTTTNPDDLKVLLAAPTGIAAYLIKGNTLHSLFKIPVNQSLTYKPLTSDKLNTLRCHFSFVKLLIIDEISMVGNRMLSYIHHRLQQIMGSTKIFGGLSVLAVGDLFQLKPVFDGWIFENLNQDYGPLATNLWTDNFKVYPLLQIMRQKNSTDFALLLNRLRESKHTADDIQLLKTRLIDSDVFRPDYPLKLPHIYLSNKLDDSHNNLVFETSPGSNKISIQAVDVVLGDVSKEVKNRVKRSIPQTTSKTMGLTLLYKSAVGMRNELTCNVDVEDGLANGAGCILEAVGSVSDSGKIGHVWVQFEDESVGKTCRNDNKHLYNSAIKKSWTPIFKVKRQFPVGHYKSVMVMREQIPLRSASAKTCHRCQGDTMEAAVVDFTGRSFPHAHYVAMSRVKTIDKLYIKNLNETAINTSALVKEEMNRLNTDMKLVSPLAAYSSEQGLCFRMLYQNVRSLKKHIKDIQPDIQYTCSDLIIFTETKLKSSDLSESLQLPDFHIHRFDCPSASQTVASYGIAVYTKYELDEAAVYHKIHRTYAKTVIEVVILNILTRLPDVPNLKVGVVYSSPKTTWPELEKVLTEIKDILQADTPIIITGDFNIDLLANPSHEIVHLLGFQQKIKQSTTDKNSLLDHLYVSKMPVNVTTGVLESHFSDHKPVYLLLQ